MPNPAGDRKKKKKAAKKKKKVKKISEDPKIIRALASAAAKGDLDALGEVLDVSNLKDRAWDLKAKSGACIVDAAENGHLDAVDFIIEAGGCVDIQNGKALQRACERKQFLMAQHLVSKGANVNSKASFTEKSPLHFAAQAGSLEIVTFLVSSKANLDQRCHERNCASQNGWAAIHYAADEGHLDIVNFLVARGAKIDLKTTCGDTAIAIAAEHGHFDVVRWLVKNGAHIHTKRRHLNATQWAIYRSEPEAVQFLVSYGGRAELDNRVLAFGEETLRQRIVEEMDPKLYEQLDLAIYRGNLQLRERAAKRRLLSELHWDTPPTYDPYSFDSAPTTETRKFSPEIIQIISAFEM